MDTAVVVEGSTLINCPPLVPPSVPLVVLGGPEGPQYGGVDGESESPVDPAPLRGDPLPTTVDAAAFSPSMAEVDDEPFRDVGDPSLTTAFPPRDGGDPLLMADDDDDDDDESGITSFEIFRRGRTVGSSFCPPGTSVVVVSSFFFGILLYE